MPFAAAIFDMDGTIANTMPWHAKAWESLWPELGISVDHNDFFRWSAGAINAEIWPRLLGRLVPADELQHLGHRKETLYREIARPSLAAIAGLDQLLDRFDARGIALGVATAAPPDNIAFVLDTLDLRRRFRHVVGAADISRGKPDPEIFLTAAARLGVDPTRCLAFEDAPAGLESAKRAGMRVAALTTTLDRAALLALPDAARPHAIIDDFREFDIDSLATP